MDSKQHDKEILIVGSSLAGLTFALACASRGIRTRVLERGHGHHQNGGALGVDRHLLVRAVGKEQRVGKQIASFPVLTEHRQAVSWQALHDWLCNLAIQRPEITLLDGYPVSEVVQAGASAIAFIASGESFTAHVIVGADGYRSLVRRAVSSENAVAPYAGYLLWRGLVSEAELPMHTRFAADNEGVALTTRTGYRLVAYPVAGRDGSLVPGQRLISFTWYDANRNDLLHEMHCVSTAGQVLSSLAPERVPARVSAELRDLALRIWPDPWRTAIVHALEHRRVFATPVAEYSPDRLCCGRLAIIGDAAHVVSPATGEGFSACIQDAEALANCLAINFNHDVGDLSDALENYEQKRLSAARQLAAKSMEWSCAYLSGMVAPRRAKRRKFLENKS